MFDLLKKFVKKHQQKETIAFFKNGQLTNVVPMPEGNLYNNREVFYNARYIVSEHCKYDLENEESIRSISTPDFKVFSVLGLGVAGNLVYVLRMKASYLKEDGKKELALALLKRATEMMPVSRITWNKEDYLLFSDWLCEFGEFEAAKTARKCVNDLFETTLNYGEITHQKNMENAESLDTDLVEADYFLGCCGECAKYRGRWFSISVKDKRFPKMPVDYGCTCSGLDFYPTIYGISEPIYCPENVDIIMYSNRPFVDDRSEQEKADYIVRKKESDNEDWYEPYAQRVEKIRAFDKVCYESINEKLPDIAPKSYSGYVRMKNSNSKNYQKLVLSAEQVGISLNYPPDLEKEYQELKPIIEEYKRVKTECSAYWKKRKE
ncbi:MAG: phage minor capsid protein [Lachnospiraceae bacterium]|nr:phage minor capsid protein [Lachnospiraceae bacterium]